MTLGTKVAPGVLPLPNAYKFLASNGFASEAADVKASIRGENLFLQRAKRGMLIEVLRSKGLLDGFVSEYWPFGATEAGRRRMTRYEKCYAEWRTKEETDSDLDSLDSEADRFACEEDLQDYLAANPGILERGMSLWPVGEGQRAVEHRLSEGRRIDILAKDSAGIPVVIELKVGGGHERVIGQALYYRARVKETLGVPRVRIIVVAREISPELRVCAKDLPDVELFEYRLSMSVTKVQ